MKTVRQLADEIGVSKQAVQKRISREPLYTSLSPYISTTGNTKYIDGEGEKLIKSAFVQKKTTTVAGNRQPKDVDTVYTVIGMLKKELEAKNNQLAKKDEQIEKLTTALENTTASLHAAQALHAGTMHKQLEVGTEEPQPEDAAEPAHQEPEKKPGLFARIFGTK